MARDEDDAEALRAALGLAPDDDLAAASATARSRRRWSRQLAAESATVAGILLALAERDEPVTVHCGPWALAGRLHSVTDAVCIMELPADDVALLAAGAIAAVQSAEQVSDDRQPPAGPDLPGVLAILAPERPAVRLLLADGAELAGVLVGVGKDAAAVRLTSSVATVRLSALAGCILVARGHENRPRGSYAEDSLTDFGSLEDFGSG